MSLNPTTFFFILPVPSDEIDRSCMSVMGIEFATFYNFAI